MALSIYVMIRTTTTASAVTKIVAIVEDKLGFIWIATSNGLNRLDKNGQNLRRFHYTIKPNSISHNRIRALYAAKDGALWVGTFRGLNRIDPETLSFSHYFNEPGNPDSLSHNTVFAIAQDSKGHLWLGTDGGFKSTRCCQPGF